MTPAEYIETRLDDQLHWYEQKSAAAQNSFKRLRTVEFICAASIPFFAGLVAKDLAVIQWVIGIAGLVVAVIAALQGLYQWQEHWIQYRSTAEALKREKMFYLTGTGPYSDDEASNFKLLVNRVEALLVNENHSWAKNLLAAAEERVEEGKAG